MMANAASAESSAAVSGTNFEALRDSVSRISSLPHLILETIRNPAANPSRSLIVLAIFMLVVLIAVLTVVMISIRPTKRGATRRGGTSATGATGQSLGGERTRLRRKRLLVAAALSVLLVALLWTSLGVSSASRHTCLSCHARNPHSSASRDPHASVACVSCHEDGGLAARFTVNSASRLAHVVRGVDGVAADGYGQTISTRSCTGCHHAELTQVTIDKERSLRMSHAEPLEAGADCVDCHTLQSGLVSTLTTGMDSCLRCHQGSAVSASCELCHLADPASLRLVSDDTSRPMKRLVPEPQCGGCHGAQEKCDACHGIRMPHSEEFMLYGHAREGAMDVWTNGGRTCAKCHYEGRRPCTGCHFSFPSHPPSFRYSHQSIPWGSGCNCHQWNERLSGMPFCGVCHPKKPASAR